MVRKNLLAAVVAASSVVVLAPVQGASAAALTTLHAFCSNPNCPDGQAPNYGLVAGLGGDFYGTTSEGTVFQLVYDQHTGKWTFKKIHTFCRQRGCTDGELPIGTLVADTSGNLYGVAAYGGLSKGAGMVFELRPASSGKWSYKILYKFCSLHSCQDGELAYSGLTWLGQASGQAYDGKSPLYGTTLLGGTHGQGVAFEIAPGSGGRWSQSVIYDFCAKSGCADGMSPYGGLTMDSAGNIFGVTQNSEGGSAGVAFELSSSGGRWTESVLYTFCAQSGCADGEGPNPLVMDTSGNLFGTTYEGGANGSGVLFELARGATGYSYSVLSNFCSQSDCADGSTPFGQLSIDASGDLFGTTSYGGGNDIDYYGLGGGTIFEWSSTGSFGVLYSFCAKTSCTDGEYPVAGVLRDSHGNLFGTTGSGGKYSPDGGTAYEEAN